MRKQVSECDDSAAVKQDLASPVFIVQLAEKFAAEGAKIVIGDIQEALAMESAEKIQKE